MDDGGEQHRREPKGQSCVHPTILPRAADFPHAKPVAHSVVRGSSRTYRRIMTTTAPPDQSRTAAMAIDVHGLTKTYGSGATRVEALRGVDLTIARGEFVAIMGPSGSGKSTLLHTLGALESSTSGTVAVRGERYDGLDDKRLTRFRRDHIGFVFQFFNLLTSLTALENVLLPALISGDRPEPHMRRAQALLATVGLADRADHVPAELSGGEQQRVSIARALLLSPEIVLADEPTGNLDSRAGQGVLRLLRQINESEGHTIVMVTHDPAAAATADRVVFLRDGRIAGEVPGGSTADVVSFFTTLDPEATATG
jgi:putative ABC transport system ATP-binding protein